MTAPLHHRTAPDVAAAAAPTAPEPAPTWDGDRDPAFFRAVARLFPPATTLAMTVLLASNDRDDADVGTSSRRSRG